MQTNNLDLAGYLLLHGLEPIAVRLISSGRSFTFDDRDAMVVAKRFWANTPVPIRDFVRAREQAKRFPVPEAGIPGVERRREDRRQGDRRGRRTDDPTGLEEAALDRPKSR